MAIDIGTVSYNEAIAAVTNYYNVDSASAINTINEYNLTPEQLYDMLPNTQNVWNTTYSNSGAVLGVDNVANIKFAGNDTASQAAGAIDSNVQTATQTGSNLTNIPAQSTVDQQSGSVTMTRGATSASTGNTVLAVADKISLGVVGVSIGTKLGAFIDSTIYNAAPDYWDSVFPTINPQTWDTIATTQGGKQFIRGLFGISGDQSGMYIPEDVFAYYALGMAKEGFFSQIAVNPDFPSGSISITGAVNAPQLSTFYNLWKTGFNNPIVNFNWDYSDLYNAISSAINITNNVLVISAAQSTADIYAFPINSTLSYITPTAVGSTPRHTRWLISNNSATNKPVVTARPFQYLSDYPTYFNGRANGQYTYGTTTYYFINDLNTTFEQVIPGVSPQPNITFPDINPDASVADVLAQLKTLYPDLWDRAITESVVQPDGTTKTYTYVPLPITDTDNIKQTNPTNTTVTSDDYIVNPTTTPQNILDTITRYLTGTQATPQGNVPIDTTDNPPDTGNGDTPDIVLPVGNASALWSVYNPTLQEINSFGSWLWSSNFIDQLLKMFSDPMQAIIGLHKIFVPPVTGASQNIVVGYLNSGVSALTVPTQYSSLDCGTIDLLEYFGNVFDYAPYTRVYIYLPFVGFKQLDTSLVIRSTLQVIYHCDAFTGAGLVDIIAIRDGNTTTIYSFSCDLACKYPLSQGSYMGIVSSIASLATGILTGNAMLTAGSVVNAISNSKTQTELSGSYTGNSGAMGIKKPYLVIIRPQTQIASGFEMYQGYSDNRVVTISDVSGYAMFTDIRTNNIQYATESELSDIVTYLSNGVVI